MDFIEYMDFMDYLYEEPYNYPERRYLRDAENPMEFYDSEEFRKRFRFSKDTVQQVLLPLIFNGQHTRNNRGLPIPPVIQLLIALRFYATGNFQIVCGDLHKLGQTSACKSVAKISKALAHKVRQFVKFPDEREKNSIARKFYRIAGFPGIRGAIDCTHIPIKNPNRANGEAFRNRKGAFSVNVQIVCGPDRKIYDIVVRWPGSVHDSRIFANSRCKMQFEEGALTGLLIGDSGYAQTSYMYTPILNPLTEPEQRYNRAHISTRNIVERLFGNLKRRFACLSRKLQNNLRNTCNIIVACAVLHNICVDTNEEEDLNSEESLPNTIPVRNVPDTTRGSLIRAAFIERHFT